MAIWYHDAIYRYGARDNEYRSAELFKDTASAQMPAAFVERVYQFIIATRHTGAADDSATALLVDIDLSGFGLPWDEYLVDSEALRREAQHISDEEYYQGKLRFLGELIQWPSIFQSEFFRERLEANARANIERYSGQLHEQGFGPSQTP